MRIEAGGKSYEFDPDRFLNVELIAVERATGLNAAEWQDGLNRGSMMAATALVWILEKRQGTRVPVLDNDGKPTGRTRPMLFDDVEFEAQTLDLAPEDEDEGKDSTPESSSATTSEPAKPSGIITSDSPMTYREIPANPEDYQYHENAGDMGRTIPNATSSPSSEPSVSGHTNSET